jgi:hypothetical protein
MHVDELAKLLPTKENDWTLENKIYPQNERHNLRIFIGIIDILQDFNLYKKGESVSKIGVEVSNKFVYLII